MMATTPSGHDERCDWHCDQNPPDCTCGLTAPRASRVMPKRPWPSRPFPVDNRKARKVTT